MRSAALANALADTLAAELAREGVATRLIPGHPEPVVSDREVSRALGMHPSAVGYARREGIALETALGWVGRWEEAGHARVMLALFPVEWPAERDRPEAKAAADGAYTWLVWPVRELA